MQEEKEKEQSLSDSSNNDATSSETLSDVEETETISDQPDHGGSDPLAPDGDVPSDEGRRKSSEGVDPV